MPSKNTKGLLLCGGRWEYIFAQLTDNSALAYCMNFDIKSKGRGEFWVTDLALTAYNKWKPSSRRNYQDNMEAGTDWKEQW